MDIVNYKVNTIELMFHIVAIWIFVGALLGFCGILGKDASDSLMGWLKTMWKIVSWPLYITMRG